MSVAASFNWLAARCRWARTRCSVRLANAGSRASASIRRERSTIGEHLHGLTRSDPLETGQDGQHARPEHDRQCRVDRSARGPLAGVLPRRDRPGLYRLAVEEPLQVGRQFRSASRNAARPAFRDISARSSRGRAAGRAASARGDGGSCVRDQAKRLQIGLTPVRRPSRQQLVKDHAQGVDIGRGAVFANAARQPVPGPCRRASRSARRCASHPKSGRAAWPGRSRRSAE